MNEPLKIEPREFRARPKFIVLVWVTLFLVTGLTAGMAVRLWQQQVLQLPAPFKSTVLLFPLVMLPLACDSIFLMHRWRLRVDQRGIARRFRWKWDLWTWQELRDGTVTGRGKCFRSTARPWWRRRLCLTYLGDADRDEVQQFMKQMAPGLAADLRLSHVP
jgi:hypothetical protein